jgi:hypothetical protein
MVSGLTGLLSRASMLNKLIAVRELTGETNTAAS